MKWIKGITPIVSKIVCLSVIGMDLGNHKGFSYGSSPEKTSYCC
jgi:hypothetical protein